MITVTDQVSTVDTMVSRVTAWLGATQLDEQRYHELLNQLKVAYNNINHQRTVTSFDFGMLEHAMGDVQALNYLAKNDTVHFQAFMRQVFNAKHYELLSTEGILLVELTRYFWKLGSQDQKYEKVGKYFFNYIYAEKLGNQFFVDGF